jgi:hypothetical protein
MDVHLCCVSCIMGNFHMFMTLIMVYIPTVLWDRDEK